MAKNGIQLKVRARVTVRANLQQLIGGATEETIVARVGEASSAPSVRPKTHAMVLENPDVISKAVLARKLDSQTAFKIVSIDIADIDVGENIGARLQADQAEADTRVARAQAEGRRAAAVAREQEMTAAIEDSRAKVVDAEAEVPKAMSEAFRTSKLSVMDYFKLRNVQADTDMRKSIATSATAGGRPREYHAGFGKVAAGDRGAAAGPAATTRSAARSTAACSPAGAPAAAQAGSSGTSIATAASFPRGSGGRGSPGRRNRRGGAGAAASRGRQTRRETPGHQRHYRPRCPVRLGSRPG